MPNVADAAARVWYGGGAGAIAARAALAPAAALYGAAVHVRRALYDVGALASHPLALPALSVGNVTVGGTGKTPVAAWFAERLHAAGARPAIVLRGYGDDEPLVHAALAPHAIVVADADRVRGTGEAARRGADVAVLDDAFQHRRARRDVDVVLVSAERASSRARLLPAGPYREPLSALARASAILITRKSAPLAAIDDVAAIVADVARDVPVAAVGLWLDVVRAWSGDAVAPLDALRGERVLAVAAIGEPSAFFDQLAALGALVDAAPYPDHHGFDRRDVARLSRRAESADRVVCTLKDAVKLGPLWPRLAPPLWYVSQRVAVERGGDVLDALVARLRDARPHRTEPAGSGRPT